MGIRSVTIALSAFVSISAFGITTSPAAQSGDADSIKQAIIHESIATYPGNCPCPYNRASNGSRCGRRSAYSRPGGYSPICYAGDVTNGMIDAYRERHPAKPHKSSNSN